MNNLIKILWIEEETSDALSERRAYIESSLDYEVAILETYSEAMKVLKDDLNYDVIIVDLRIPKGDFFEKMEDYSLENKDFNAYGINLIRFLSKKSQNNKIMIYSNESWADVEAEISSYIKKQQFLQKKDCRSNRMFDNFIKTIYTSSIAV